MGTPGNSLRRKLSIRCPARSASTRNLRTAVRRDVPMGHKITVRPIETESTVLKYGQVIGLVGNKWGTGGKNKAALVVSRQVDFGLARIYEQKLESKSPLMAASPITRPNPSPNPHILLINRCHMIFFLQKSVFVTSSRFAAIVQAIQVSWQRN